LLETLPPLATRRAFRGRAAGTCDLALCLRQHVAHRHSTVTDPPGCVCRVSRQPKDVLMSV